MGNDSRLDASPCKILYVFEDMVLDRMVFFSILLTHSFKEDMMLEHVDDLNSDELAITRESNRKQR